MTTAAVTGGSGFIGGHLVEALRRRGVEVRALVRESSHTEVLDRVGAQLVRGDLQDPCSVAALVEGADVIYHCGAIVSDWAAPGMFEAVNAGGTRNVVEAALRASARLVHVSSTDVYGFPDKGGLDETSPRQRRGWGYVDAKIAGEEAVDQAIAMRQLDAVIVRPASVYGPRCPYFVEGCVELMNAGELSFIDDGSATGGFIYVADLVELILVAAERANTGEIFNGTGGRRETWRDYFDGLAQVTGATAITTNLDKAEAFAAAEAYEQAAAAEPPPLTRHAWAMYATDQDFSVAKAAVQLDWHPTVPLAEGLKNVGTWWKDARK
jgi:nucleoside-diphosphate-sugar epimerase